MSILNIVFNASYPYTNYGMNNEKGTGLELSFCQERAKKMMVLFGLKIL